LAGRHRNRDEPVCANFQSGIVGVRVFATVELRVRLGARCDRHPVASSMPTTMAKLQELGACKSELMVKRYVHSAPEQLLGPATGLADFFGTPRADRIPRARASC
jgi:hypothetical protein